MITLKSGTKLKVKSLEWYEQNKGRDGIVSLGPHFVKEMKHLCGTIVTVNYVKMDPECRFTVLESKFNWSLDFVENPEDVFVEEVGESLLIISEGNSLFVNKKSAMDLASLILEKLLN